MSSGEEEDCAGAVLVRRRSSEATPPLPSLRRCSQSNTPGAFRAGSSIFFDEENTEGEEDEGAANENNNNYNPNNGTVTADNRLCASSHSSVPLEATLVADNESCTITEVVKAEPLSIPSSNSVDSKQLRKKRLMLWLLVSILVVMVAGAVTAATVFLLRREKNESEVVEVRVESNDSASSDSRVEEPLSASEMLARYDRITHHAAIFQWHAPTRCNLEPESTSWWDEPFVLLQCGQGYGSNSSLSLYKGQVFGAECTRRGDNQVGCKARNMASTSGSSPTKSYAALVLFTCGTLSRDYNNKTNSSVMPQTAQIRVEKTEAYCEAPLNSTLVDGEVDVQVALSLHRICRSSDTSSAVRPSSVCRIDTSDDLFTDDSLYNLSEKACLRQGAPCLPQGNIVFCDVDFDAFSAVDETSDDENCRFNSLEDQEELFQNGAYGALKAVSDLPELEIVESLIPSP